jgi:hypothetical protein
MQPLPPFHATATLVLPTPNWNQQSWSRNLSSARARIHPLQRRGRRGVQSPVVGALRTDDSHAATTGHPDEAALLGWLGRPRRLRLRSVEGARQRLVRDDLARA